MSKPEELIKRVEELTHEEYDASTWISWFNDVLSDLTAALRLETYETLTLANVDNHLLPGDIYEIVRFAINKISSGNVKDDVDLERGRIGQVYDRFGGKNVYWVWDGRIYFPEPKTGTGKLWYHRYPAKLTLGSTGPDIPERYEDVLILGAAAKSKAPDRWLEDKNDFIRDYLVRRDQIANDRQINTLRRYRIQLRR